MAKLKPSQREKKRYVVYEIDTKFPFAAVKKAIIRCLLHYLGEFGYTKAKPSIIENTFTGKKRILRVTNKSLLDVKKALNLMKKIEGKDVTFRTIGVSGTIKKAKMKFLG